METNLDEKQLLVLGYLRNLLKQANILQASLNGNDANDSPPLPPLSKYDENIELLPFNLGIPSMQPRSSSMDSVASHLSDHDLIHSLPSSNISVPLTVIQNVYLYFNRFQRYLFLLGGSEECKDHAYNQVQIINLRNLSDIQQKIEYPYTNYRLQPHLWRDKIDYKTYFKAPTKKNMRSSLTAAGLSTITTKEEPTTLLSIVQEGKTAATKGKKPETPTSIMLPFEIQVDEKEEVVLKKRDSKTRIKVSSPSSPWSSQNSPFFDSSALIPFNALRNKPRSKSVSKLSKLQRKEAPSVKLSKISKQKERKYASKSTKYKIEPKKKAMNKLQQIKALKKAKSSKVIIEPKQLQKRGSKKKNNSPKKKQTIKSKLSPKKKGKISKTIALKKGGVSHKKSPKRNMKRAKSVKVIKSDLPLISHSKRVPKAKIKKHVLKRKTSAASIRSVPVALKQPNLGTSSLAKPATIKRRKSTSSLHKKKGKRNTKKGNINIVTGNKEYDRYSYGECIMSISNDINGGIPSWPWFKAKYKSEIKRKKDALEFCKFKMFLRCGGIYTNDDEYTNENDLFLFNAASLNDIGREIDSYYCKLPNFKQKIEAPAIVYNGVDNLLSFGGYSYDEGKALKNIYSLNLNTKRSQFKWKKYGCMMNKARYNASVTHIINNRGHNKFIIIGGKGSSTKPIDVVSMFDSSKTTKSSKCTPLSELNFKRFKAGSCQLHAANRDKIAVAGGILYGNGVNKVEIYDIHKDKWMVHHSELQYDHQHPTIWAETPQINPNILYIAGNNISFGAKKGSLGYIEWIDLRVKKKKFNLLYDEAIEELFEFWALRPNIWEPRTLLHFQL